MKNIVSKHQLACVVCALLVLVLSSCTTRMIRGEGHESRWIQPSPFLEIQIEENAAKLPWTHGAERVELVRWFAGIGEPAYDFLLALAADSRPDVAGSALAALGATRDHRLVEPIRAVDIRVESSQNLALERARTLAFLGDWSGIPLLIDGLESEKLATRALCGRALQLATGDARGYKPRDEQTQRDASVERWRAWWAERESEGILAKS